MKEHRAKTAALLAYAEGLLSVDGARRIEAHLAGCKICRQELAAVELYDRMVDDVHEAELPEFDFSRMELTLAREAKRVSQEIEKESAAAASAAASAESASTGGSGLRWAVAGLAAVAAIALYMNSGLGPSDDVPPTPVAETVETAPEPEVQFASLSPRLTLSAGEVRRASAAAPDGALLAVGEELAVGDVVRADGEAHVRLEEGLGFVLSGPFVPSDSGDPASGEPASLELVRADLGGVRLALSGGRVDSTVDPAEERVEGWQRDSTYVVLAGRYEVRASGPVRFVTSYLDGELTVGAHAGRLTIHRDGDEVARLEAPGQWSSRPGLADEAAAARSPRGLGTVLAAADATLVTLSHADLVRWSLDGTEVAHGGPVQMRVRNGTHRVTGWTLSGEPYELTFEAVGAPTMVDEGQIRTSAPPRMRAGHLEPHIIASVVGRGQRSFQQCWRRTLRENTEAQQGTLQVTIGSLGDVSRVRVTGLTGPGAVELRECIGNYARRWEFPPPGGPVTFNQPLRFSPRM